VSRASLTPGPSVRRSPLSNCAGAVGYPVFYDTGCWSRSRVGTSSETVVYRQSAACGRWTYIAAGVSFYAGLFEPEVIRIRPPADRQQHIGADHRGIAVAAFDADRHTFGMRRQTDALGAGAQGNALVF